MFWGYCFIGTFDAVTEPLRKNLKFLNIPITPCKNMFEVNNCELFQIFIFAFRILLSAVYT